MGASSSAPARVAYQKQGSVPSGMSRLCLAGFPISHNTGQAVQLIRAIVAAYPEQYESMFSFAGPAAYREFIHSVKPLCNNAEDFESHRSSPFVWIEKDDGTATIIGGNDNTRDWAKEKFSADDEKNATILAISNRSPSRLKDALFDNKTPGTVVYEAAVPEEPVQAGEEDAADVAPEAGKDEAAESAEPVQEEKKDAAADA